MYREFLNQKVFFPPSVQFSLSLFQIKLNFKNKIMKNLPKFAEESSIHGIKYIFSENYSKSARVFFCCSILGTLCGFSYYMYSAFIKFKIEPETVMRSNNLNSTDFPVPAITLCPNVFARGDYPNFYNIYQKHKNQEIFNISEVECRYLISNTHWCNPNFNQEAQDICDQYDMKDLNVVDAINKSSLQMQDCFFYCRKNPLLCDESIVRVFTPFGVCYTFNMQGFNTIFNTKVIHDDFKCYQKKNYENASDIQWSPEKGYATPETNFPRRADFGTLKMIYPSLSPVDRDNFCSMKFFQLFIHKPNEILTPYHETINFKHDEVRIVKFQ